MKRYILLLSMLLVGLALLASCGDGDGSDGGSGNPPVSGDIVNPKLSGRLYVRGQGRNFILDLPTGKYTTRLPITKPILGASGGSSVYPVPDGEGYIETVTGCYYPEGSLTHKDCIYIYNKDGGRENFMEVYEGIVGVPKLSYDKQYVALVYDSEKKFTVTKTKKFLEIFDRSGQLVSSTNLNEQHPDVEEDTPHTQWLPDGRLVYAYGWGIYITAPYDTRGTLLVSFEDDKERGFPSNPSVSPDGKRLAFERTTRVFSVGVEGSVWVMDIDNPIDRYPLAYVPGDDTPTIEFPEWSPDGKWILVREGYMQSVLDPGLLGRTSTLYAVPSDGVRVPLTRTGQTTAVEVFQDSLQLSTWGDKYTHGNMTSEFKWAPFAWIP